MNLSSKLHKAIFATGALVFSGVLAATPASAASPTAAKAAIVPATPAPAGAPALGLFSISASGQSVNEWTGNQNWTQIGGASAGIAVGPTGVVSIAPGSNNVYLNNGSGWTQIGGAAKQVVQDSSGNIFSISASGQSVNEWTGNQNWTQIGGASAGIAVGPTGVVSIAPGSNNVYLNNGTGWTQIGGAAKQVVQDSSGNIFSISASGQSVNEWTGNQSWTQIGGPSESLTAGGPGLISIAPSSLNVFAYTGSGWTQIGGAAKEVAQDSSGDIFSISASGQSVNEWTGGQSWTQIGGPAEHLAAY
ncbi:tectonin domain-containing protein [Streptacidiphilus sp. P02-A3a]|uniref:tectonin domain-containing protein n=1 Tax=Streptacidiphilus sp. P02-A3a TaxID=2704468 RepID=UPI0015FB4E9D|nr:tectonin domain-containing protein [Streptacidiphilus sp. P02-A3a]QMU70622.1 hypothetical protein GXP74_22875 [Streptacidiphilus sp. P02-A3a]